MKTLHAYLILALSIVLVGTLPVLADSKAESWNYPSSNPGFGSFSGSGTASSPYLIQSAQDLANLAYIVTDANKDVAGKYFKMTRDIYLNDFTVDAEGKITANGDLKDWTPIGEYGKFRDDDFQGIFDGDGHTIYGLYINESSPRHYIGLFGSTEDAIIKNLTIKNVYIHTNSSDYHDCVIGTLVGRVLNSTFTNVGVKGCYMQVDGSYYTICQGGLIGYVQNDVTLNDCFFEGNICTTSYNDVNVGGLIGDYVKSGIHNYITLRLTRCQTKGEIKIINQSKYTSTEIHIGGLVGGSYTDDKHIYITECVNRLNLTIEGNDNRANPKEFNANHYAYRITEVKKSANLGTVTVASDKITYVGIFQAVSGSRYVDCVNYGHCILPENHDNTETKVLTGSNKIYHDENGENLIICKEAKPTNLGAKDQFECNGTELSLDELDNNQELIDKLNEEAGENVWGFDDITENGKTYSVPFPVSCGGTPSNLYKNEKGQYLISSEADLRILQERSKQSIIPTADYYILTQDISMSGSAPLEQIGDENHPFIGTFDGNGHVISGLTIKGRALFGNLSGTVKNLGLVNMKFMGGNAFCAPFAYKAGGSADASVVNCYAGGTITLADSINNSTTLAGLLYEATDHNVSIKNSYFKGIMANATNVSNQGHFYYGLVGSNKIGTSLTLNDCYANFDFNEILGIGAGILPADEASKPDVTNSHYLCPKFDDINGKLNSNAELAACFAGKEGWLTGAYRPVLENARHYTLTTYDEQTVYADAIPLDDDSCRNEIFCYQATTETVNDPLIWALPKVAVCDTENNVNYLLNCQLYADKPFRFTPPEGSVTKGQVHFPLTFTGDNAIRMMCLPATLHKSNLPESTDLYLMGKPTGDAAEGYQTYIVACDSVPAGIPFLIYMTNKPTEAIDVVLRGDIVTAPQTTGTLNGEVLESGLVGTFEDTLLESGCAHFDFSIAGINVKHEEDIDLKPFDAYIDADATVLCNAGVLLKETSNYISETLDMYKDRMLTVFLSRKLQSSGWNTLCLPFAVSNYELCNKFGNDTRLEELTGITTEADGICTLSFTSAQSIEAGKCYLIKPAIAWNYSYQFDDKTLSTEPVATTLTSTDGSYTLSFKGSFARSIIDGNDTSKGTYFTQDNKIYKVAEGRSITMNGFRCWIETSKSDALTKAMISHSDGTTSVANIVCVGSTENNHRIYDIQGIETTHPDNRHIYIKDGRKWVGSENQ